MYNQSHAIHSKVTTLKQMNNWPKDYIYIFIAFIFKKTLKGRRKTSSRDWTKQYSGHLYWTKMDRMGPK